MVVPAGARSIDSMKNIWLWILGGVALIGVLYLYLKRGTARNTPSQANPGTASNPAAWFGGWMGYTQNALAGGSATAQGAFSALNSLSNAFGINDGGNSDVSIGEALRVACNLPARVRAWQLTIAVTTIRITTFFDEQEIFFFDSSAGRSGDRLCSLAVASEAGAG